MLEKYTCAAFGSTYTNEVARVDGDWRRRLYNPIAKTFVAVRPRDRRIFASTSLFGPMPNSEVVSNPNIVSPTTSSSREASAPLLFKLTGVYTCAEARGQGLGQAIVKVAVARAFSEARQRNEECRVEVDVYARNTAAISFYEKCGFRINGPRPDDTDPEDALSELIMYYQP